MEALADRKQAIQRRMRAREFVFGIQDGLLTAVGLLTGVSAARQSTLTVVITGITAAVTGGVSMATGAYLSARTEKDLFEKEFLDQERLAAEQPFLAQEALLESLVGEGLDRPAAYRVVKTIATNQDLLLRTVQEKVLGLGTADISQPVTAGLVMFLSFVIGAAIPLLPYLLGAGVPALPVSWALSVVTLLGVGVFKGKLTGKPLLRSGLEFAAVALGSALVGWLLGKAFDRALG
jgi:VIT1/CCC1 family predicted Fe2+/Mn2+ transporter